MAKDFTFKGKSIDEIKKMDVKEFAQLIPSRDRKSLLRGFSHEQQMLLEHIKENKRKLNTHCRELVIIPAMLDKTIGVYNGKEFKNVVILPEMLGHRLGEFSQTRTQLKHSAPGIGATKSSGALSVK